MRFQKRIVTITAASTLVLGAASAAPQSQFVVNTTSDTEDALPGDGLGLDANGKTSLRAAIQEANASGGATTIRLTPGATYSLTRAGANEDSSSTGDLDVVGDITLQGRGATIHAMGADRAFDVLLGASLRVNQLTVTGGSVVDENGGAFRNAGTLVLDRSEVNDSSALGTAASGGAIANEGGTLRVLRSSFHGNESERAGGAIEANAGTTEIFDSRFFLNTTGPAPGNGGGFHLTGMGEVQVEFSEFEGNTAASEGGGLWNSAVGNMTIDDTRMSNNTAAGAAADNGGGGLFNDGGLLVVRSSTVTENRATGASGSGGGILNDGGELVVAETSIWNNSSSRAGGGIEANAGTTTVSDSSMVSNLTGPSPGNGGGLHLTGAGDVTVDDTDVAGNFASAEGGGLWNSAVGQMTIRRSTVENNVASGNDADQGGGGLFNDGGTMTVSGSFVNSNTADGTSGSGGGALNNQGILVVRRSTFADNQSKRAGGGIEANVGETSLSGVTLRGNSTGPAPGNGGGLHLTGPGSVDIERGNITGNAAGNEGGGLWNSSTGTMTVITTSVMNNFAPIGVNVFNDGGTFTIDGGDVPPGP